MSGELTASASQVSTDDSAGSVVPALTATCWGTRGSIPSPGPDTARFGGNTPCLQIRTAAGRDLVFDAGTGIRALGNHLEEAPDPVKLNLFLTHFHWDHIQGIPFFAPLHAVESVIRIHAARQDDLDIETLLRGQMGPVYFPIPYESLGASLYFEHLEGEPWSNNDTTVSAYRVRHPAHTYGYRVDSHGGSVAYLPDNELVGSSYEVDSPSWYPGLIHFLRGVDVLFHDAMFTEPEYPAVEGWGHSTFTQAVRLAEEAAVGRLFLFHHAPDRSDDELLRILDRLRSDGERRGSDLDILVAAEGEDILVHGASS